MSSKKESLHGETFARKSKTPKRGTENISSSKARKEISSSKARNEISSGKARKENTMLTSTPKIQKRELPPKPEPVAKPSKKKVKDIVSGGTASRVRSAGTDQTTDIKVREPRKRATIEGHIEKYDQILALLDSEIDRKSREKEKGARAFRKVRKIVIQMRKELPVVTRSKAARMQSRLRKGTTSGIMIQCQISEELANFIKVSPETRISRIEATRAICAYAHWKDDEKREEVLRWQHLNPEGRRDLQNPQDKKSIIPDKALVKLLRYEKYKKDIKNGKITKKVKDKETGKTNVVQMTDDILYYWVIQKLITVHFIKDDEGIGEEE